MGGEYGGRVLISSNCELSCASRSRGNDVGKQPPSNGKVLEDVSFGVDNIEEGVLEYGRIRGDSEGGHDTIGAVRFPYGIGL